MKNKGINTEDLKHKHSEKVEELERQIKANDQRLNAYKREHGKLEVFFDRVLNAISPITPFSSELSKITRTHKSETKVEAVYHITDSHMGSVQEADEIEGFNEFSPEICDARNLAYIRRGLEWVELHRNAYNIETANVIMTGDLISGDIHDELRITNAFPAPEQVVRAAQIHAKQIAVLAPMFENINVHFITEDNHSRLTKKPQAKEAGMNSFNYLVGRMIELYISKHNNVSFNLYPMNEKVVTCLNRNYLIKHGHGIKAWMGIPFYGIERMIARESTARQNIIMSDLNRAKDLGFHKIVMGHFHTPIDHPLYSMSGSIQGTDAYDHAAGRYAPPSQSSWLIHPKYGEFDRINFNLTHV